MNTDYKLKYIKYKNKYLSLKSLVGGSETTEKAYFYGQLNKKYGKVYDILISDQFFLISQIPELFDELPKEKPDDVLNNQVFKKLFCLFRQFGRNYTQQLLEIYLSGNLGTPNSLENTGRLIDSLNNNNRLPSEHKFKSKVSSLTEIEDHIESKRQILEQIDAKKAKKGIMKERQERLKEAGEDDVEVLLDTPNVIVYHPTTEAGSKYYGRNTRWCTAAESNNMFNMYNRMGPLYIIELKKHTDFDGNRIKYQIHFPSNQFMNSADQTVRLNNITKQVDDPLYTQWIEQFFLDNILFDSPYVTVYKPLSMKAFRNIAGESWPEIFLIDTNTYIIKLKNVYDSTGKNIKYFINFIGILYDSDNKDADIDNIIQLAADDSFNQWLKTEFLNYFQGEKRINISGNKFESLILNLGEPIPEARSFRFEESFNKTLGDSLSLFPNLTSIRFNHSFNNGYVDGVDTEPKPLGDSLSKLTKLETIDFGGRFRNGYDRYYEKPLLGDALTGLTNLKSLTIPRVFIKELEKLKDEGKLNYSLRIDYY